VQSGVYKDVCFLLFEVVIELLHAKRVMMDVLSMRLSTGQKCGRLWLQDHRLSLTMMSSSFHGAFLQRLLHRENNLPLLVSAMLDTPNAVAP
jgi:hypothetical protein